MREGDFLTLPYSTRNPIKFEIPELLYADGGMLDVPRFDSSSPDGCLSKLMNIWSTEWIHRSLYNPEGNELASSPCHRKLTLFLLGSSAWSFLRLLDMSPREAHSLHVSPLIRRQLLARQDEASFQKTDAQYSW